MFAPILSLALGAALTAAPAPSTLPPNAAIRPDTGSVIAAPESKTVVEIDNAAFPDADVYAIQGLRRVRLGTITGLAKSRLTIPRDLIGTGQPVRFIIHQIGAARNSVSDEIYVDAGDTVQLFVSP